MVKGRATIAAAVLAGFLATGPAAAENSSVYTKVDLAACREVPPDADDPLQSGVWWCDGYRGLPVYVMEGDLRFFVSYGEQAPDEPAARITLPSFNHIGDTIEWRVAFVVPVGVTSVTVAPSARVPHIEWWGPDGLRWNDRDTPRQAIPLGE